MSEKSIFRTIQLIVILGMVLGFSATTLAGWDESQEFGEFSCAEIYQSNGSVWIKGAASSFDYRPFQYREGTWSTHDDLPMEREHPDELFQGSSCVIYTLTGNYQISYEDTSVILRKGTNDYAVFTVFEHTCGVNVIDVSGDKVLLGLVLGYGDILEDDESLDKSQLLVQVECYLYSMRLVMFDFATKEWVVYPTPPINSWITCGAIYDSYLLLGTCAYSEMGTAYPGDGIAIFDIRQGNYVFINNKNSPLAHDGIIDMKIIRNELWIVNVKSIQRVNLATNEWSTYVVDKNIILKTDVDVASNQTDENIETLKVESIVPAGFVYSRMCSVPLVGRYYGYVETT